MSTNHELSELLRAERAVLPPSAAAEQGFRRLAVDLAANVAPLPVAVGPLKLGLWLVPKWIVAGFAVGVLGTVALGPRLTPTPSAPRLAPARAVSVAAPGGPPLLAQLAASAEPTPERQLASGTGALGLRALSPSVSASASVSAPKPATFDAELELLSQAKVDLDAHRVQSARARLNEHAERFPNGVFAIERDALGILTRCAEAPNEALPRQFVAQHPGSPLWQRLDRACRVGSTPTTIQEQPMRKQKLDASKWPNGSSGAGERTDNLRAGEQRP